MRLYELGFWWDCEALFSFKSRNNLQLKEKFQELRQFTRDLKEERSWFSKTFEGALFSQSPEWLSGLELRHQNARSLPSLTKRKKLTLEKAETLPPKKNDKELEIKAVKEVLKESLQAEVVIKDTVTKEFSLSRLSSEEIIINPQIRKRGEIYTQFGLSSQKLEADRGVLDILFLGHLEASPDLEGDSGLYQGSSGALLEKMIRAMSLGEEQFAYSLFSVEYDIQLSMNPVGDLKPELMEDLLLEIFNIKPRLVICLGALVTNIVLGKRERLTRIHGEIFSRKIDLPDQDTYEFQMMPIFHPEFLQINPNMKRTTWLDLKKALEFIGKA